MTDSGFKKKLMNTTNQIEASAPANVRPSSVSNTSKTAQADFVRHCENRRLPTGTVLNYLRTRLPGQYEVAEVVGKWVWLDVSPAGKPALAKLLWVSTGISGAVSGSTRAAASTPSASTLPTPAPSIAPISPPTCCPLEPKPVMNILTVTTLALSVKVSVKAAANSRKFWRFNSNSL